MCWPRPTNRIGSRCNTRRHVAVDGTQRDGRNDAPTIGSVRGRPPARLPATALSRGWTVPHRRVFAKAVQHVLRAAPAVRSRYVRAAFICAALVQACGGAARLPVEAGMGPNPTLPPPRTSLIPVVKVARAVGWPAGVTPTAAEGTTVAAFADKLDHPRWLYVLPNGDVLVAETNSPPK